MCAQRLSEAERFDHPVASALGGISAARHAFDQWLARLDAGDTVRSELAVAFSELVANALHASEGAADDVSTRAWLENGEEGPVVAVEVANPLGPTASSVERWDLDDPLRTGGRGLLIVRAYTDDVEVASAGGAVVVRCRRQLD